MVIWELCIVVFSQTMTKLGNFGSSYLGQGIFFLIGYTQIT